VEFSENTRALLKKAGWKEGRSVSAEKHLSVLTQEGYAVCERVRAFLSRYAGIVITYKMNGGKSEGSLLSIDPQNEALGVWPTWPKCFSKVVGEKLCLIGTAHNMDMALFMGETGKIYIGGEFNLFFAGNTAEEAIDAICTDAKMREVPVDSSLTECSWFKGDAP